MRPDLKNVIKEEGLVGVVNFFKSVGKDGILLSKSETDTLAAFLEGIIGSIEPTQGK